MLQVVMDNIPQMIFWKDKNLLYLDCNRSYAKFVGLESTTQIAGKTDADFHWSAAKITWLDNLDRETLSTNQPRCNIEIKTEHGGETQWLRTSRIPLTDGAGEVVGLLGIIENITEQKNTENALRESQVMLQLVMDNIPQAIFWKNRQYVIMGGNRNFFIDAGDGTPASVMGKTDYELTYRVEEADFFREVDERVMVHDQPEYHIIEPQLQADGKQAWLETNKIPLHNADGEVVGILGTYEDITERKEAEESMRRNLEQMVEERTRELSASNEKLKREIERREQIERDLTRAQAAEHEQRVLAEALRDTADLLNSTLNIETVLDLMLQVIERIVPHKTASMMLVDDEVARIVRYHGSCENDRVEPLSHRFYLGEMAHLHTMHQSRRPLFIAQIEQDAPYWINFPEYAWLRSYVGTPICVEGQVIGFLNLHSAEAGFFTALHAERLQAFANQAASAIQNARSFERAQALAAVEERQRLARDLHDAVSQTLWSANLTAEVLPDLWEQNVEEGRKSLQDLQIFTRGALAEMRALLIELRPSGLVETRLSILLRQLTESMSNRMGIPIALKVEGNCLLPSETQIAFYRIAQEALNNISRHTTATWAEVTFEHQPDYAKLSVRDNGNGFDLSSIPSGRLGLNIMRERAVSIAASLQIQSRAGQGTQIQVEWHDKTGST